MTTPPDEPAAPAPPPSPLLRRLALLFAAFTLLVVAGALLLQSPWGIRHAVNLALSGVQPWRSMALATRGAAGGLWNGIELHGVRLTDRAGRVLLDVDTLRVRYTIPELVGSGLHIRSIEVAGGRVIATRKADGRIDLIEPFLVPGSGAPGRAVRIDRIAVRRSSLELRGLGLPRDSVLRADDLAVQIDGFRNVPEPTIDRVTLGSMLEFPSAPALHARLDASARMGSGRFAIDALRLDTHDSHVELTAVLPMRAITMDSMDSLRCSLAVRPLAGADIARLGSGAGEPGDLTLGLEVSGSGPAVQATLDMHVERGGRAELRARLLPTRAGPFELDARGRAVGLDVGAMLGGAPDSMVVNGTLDARLRGADRAHVDGPLRLSLQDSRFYGTDMERADLSADFVASHATLALNARALDHDLTARGWVRPLDVIPSYDVSATLLVPATEAAADPRLGTGLPWFDGEVSATLRGRGVSADSADAELRVTGHPNAGSVSRLGDAALTVRVRDGLANWQGDAQVTGGTIAATGRLALRAPWAWQIDRGEVRGVDVAALAGDTAASRLDTDVKAEGRGLTLEQLQGHADVTRLALAYRGHALSDVALHAAVFDRRATLEGGGVLDSARLTMRGNLGALGTPPERMRGAAHLAFEPFRLNGARVDRMEASVTLESGVATLASALESSAGGAQLVALARPFDPEPGIVIQQLALREVDLGPLAGRSDLHIALTGTVTGRASGRDIETLQGELSAAFDGSRVNARRFDRVRADATLAGGVLVAGLDARGGRDSLRMDANANLRAAPRTFAARGGLHIQDLGALLGRDSLAARLSARFDANGSLAAGAPLADARVDGRVASALQLRDAAPESLTAVVQMRAGLLHVDTLALNGPFARATGAGVIALPGGSGAVPTDFALRGELLDMSRLSPLVGGHKLDASRGRFEVNAAGPPSATRLTGHVDLDDPRWDESFADSVRFSFTGTLNGFELQGLQSETHAHSVAIGTLPTRDMTVRFALEDGAYRLSTQSLLSDAREQYLDLRFDPRPGREQLRIDRLQLVAPGSTLELQQPATITFGERLHIDEFILLQNGRRVTHVTGGDDADGRLNLTASVDSLIVDEQMQLLGLGVLSGYVNGRLALTGTRAHPVLYDTTVAVLVNGRRPPARLTLGVAWRDSQLTTTLRFIQSNSAGLDLDLHLPLRASLAEPIGPGSVAWRDAPVAGNLQVRQLDFSWFQSLLSPRSIRNLRGRLDGDVVITGRSDAPQLNGKMRVSDASAELPRLAVTYEKGAALVTCAGRTIRLDTLSLVSGGGHLNAGGVATLTRHFQGTLDLNGQLDRFRVMNNIQAELQASGPIAVGGRFVSPRLSGDIRISNSTIHADFGSAQMVKHVELTEADVRELSRTFGSARERERAREASVAMFDSLGIDAQITVGENTWVRRNIDPILSLELEGRVHVTKPAGDSLQISGSLGVKTGRSFLSFLGRRFDITKANVELPGRIANMRAEVEARANTTQSSSESSNNDIEVTALVTLDEDGITTELQSNPYMEPSALINYVATGQVQGEVANGAASGMALGYVLGTLGGAAGKSLGFQVVQVTQDAYGGQTLSAGNYVRPKVYLGFRQPVVEGQNERAGTDTGSQSTEFEIEVEAVRRLLVNLQGGGREYRLLLRPRLGR